MWDTPSIDRRQRRGLRARPGDPISGRAPLCSRLVGPDLAGASGFDREPELLLERAADGAADGMVLPAGGGRDLLNGGALRPLEHLDHLRLLSAGARRGLAGRLTGRRLGLARGGRCLGGLRLALALGGLALRRR